MKNKKGFTLVELLAVVVILAIISLIVLPAINSLIADTRKKAFTDTAYGIIKAGEQYYAQKDLSQNKKTESTFNFPNDAEELDLSGDLPKEGSMIIDKKGNISLAISNGRYCVKKWKNDEEVTLTEDIENCNIPNPNIISASDECALKGKCTDEQIAKNEGVKVTVQVNDNETQDFYIISDDGEKMTLMLDRNLGELVAWYSDGDDSTNIEKSNLGPITALEYLNGQTSEWNNIKPIENYTYSNNLDLTADPYAYQKLEINNGVGKLITNEGTATSLSGVSRARLITYEEVTALQALNANAMPTYLYTNLYQNTNAYESTQDPESYWLLTSVPQASECHNRRYTYRMYHNGEILTARVSGINCASEMCAGESYADLGCVFSQPQVGVRPVIEISK